MLDMKTAFPAAKMAVQKMKLPYNDEQITAWLKDFEKKHPKVDNKLLAGVFAKVMQQPEMAKKVPQPSGVQKYLGGQ